MEATLKITGVLLILLALVHGLFPRYFKWKEELKPLTILTRELLYVHTFFIALVVFMTGLLCISSSQELLHTSFGKIISLFLAIFWGIRLLIQIFGYSSEIWKGKKFETTVHIVLLLFWTYLTAIFMLTYSA